MPSVFIIEEQVDYEGDTVVSIHATREGALAALYRMHAELAESGPSYWSDGLEAMQTGHFRCRDRYWCMTEKTLEV